ncbi:uncharacterized protein LOC114519456 [Dendronephthya gigantea]|uniref:uncharacterized protein LOC114519456 n=1 Tax=Dendronephthya gigantea TaxID=151771 RepID=UPI00106C29CB|nr:uncharacterized protein LOC114519456 [Dendronephthya gigantea]
MNKGHIEDFKSIASIDSDMSEATRRHGGRGQQTVTPIGEFNPAFGESDEAFEMSPASSNNRESEGIDGDIMMTDMINGNANQHIEDSGDNVSVASTDTYKSGTSMSSELEKSLRDQLPSHLYKEMRSMPSARGRMIRGEGPTPIGTPHLGGRSVRNRRSVRGLDERGFDLDVEGAQQHDEIRNRRISNKKEKFGYVRAWFVQVVNVHGFVHGCLQQLLGVPIFKSFTASTTRR